MNFLETLTTLPEGTDGKIIVAGDLNRCLEHEDKFGDKYVKTEYATKLANIMNEYGLTDIWRISNPDSKSFSWRKATKNGIFQSRLDSFLFSESVRYEITKCDIQNAV